MDCMKKPCNALPLLGAVLMVVSGLMSWVMIPEDSIAGIFGEEIMETMSVKQNVVLVMGVAGLLFTYLAATKKKKGMAVVSVIASLLALFMFHTGYLPAEDAELVGVAGMEAGFYVGLVGALGLLVGSVWGMKANK